MARLRVGLVGPRRARQGLGPFLASFLEQEGCEVAAVCGRDPQKTQGAAIEFERTFGHPVRALRDLAAFAGADIEALVIASPMESHLPALETAFDLRLSALCEKPLVAPGQWGAARDLVDRFASSGLLLAENCQWPYALGAFERLFGRPIPRPPRTFRMRLCPSGIGREMVVDALPHFLSVLQALAPLDAGSIRGPDLRFAGPERATLRFEVAGRTGRGTAIEAELLLERRPNQPRPASLEIDGQRMERRIGPGYRLSFEDPASGRTVPSEDPLRLLVADFARAAKGEDEAAAPRLSAPVGPRLRCLEGLLAGLIP
ncbi:MAG: hypothetical protein Fur0037_06610 [Planctomycetota bacterium]